MKRKIFLIACILGLSIQSIMAGKGYYRFPTLSNENVVFTAEGDLWLHNTELKTTQRLTTSHGMESNACFSPDGKQIAFNAQYEGITEVFVMPIGGGVPTRVTFEGLSRSFPKVAGWLPDGNILVSTASYSTLPDRQLVKINPNTFEVTKIPLAQADEGVYDNNGTLFFTRLAFNGSQTKRYKGGTAQNIWKFDGSSEAIRLVPEYAGALKNPMFFKDRIYFITDMDGTMNIWSMNPGGEDLKQHTKSIGWDVKDADLFEGRIIYQRKADLEIYDIATGETVVLDISLLSDFDQRRANWIKDPNSKITATSISADGKTIAITARGRIFTSPVDGGRWSEVTRKSGIRYRNAQFLGDKEELVFLSDESGEVELWKSDVLGFKEPEQLTNTSKVLIMSHLPSPDGKLVAYVEKDHHLKLHNISVGETKTIDIGKVGRPSDLSWSPDSKWLVYTNSADNQNAQVNVYDVEKGEGFKVTTDRLDSYNAQFSRDGKWLYFLSDRTFNTAVGSPWGPRQPEPFYNHTTKIYMIALKDSLRSPFLPDDELSLVKEKDDDEGDDKKDKKKKGQDKTKAQELDLANAMERLIEVPVPAANMLGLTITDNYIYWAQREIDDRSNIRLFAIKIENKPDNKPVEVCDNVSSYEVSDNGKKMLIRKKDGIYVVDVNGKKADFKDARVSLKNWSFMVDPVEDWKQLLVDAWRLERDYFYDKDMHGVDWDTVLERHLPLVERISDRYELDDLIAHMVSELSALHTFVYGGDKRTSPDNIAPASLGADLRPVEEGYKIEHIYNGDPDLPEQLSPLTQSHLRIVEGDVITKVNGVSVTSVPHINVLLNHKTGVQVRLELKDENNKVYEQVVTPVSKTEFGNLRYAEWEYTRRIEVEEKSDDRIGYLHLRAMGGNNYQEFVKGFYPVFQREGLIIDVRHNRGGNIDSWILEKLLRKEWFFWQSRAGAPYWNMQYAFRGHVVVLINEKTASDGEAFAEGFKRLELGKTIGTRTWGGEIWLTSSNRLVDGGLASASEFGVFDEKGEWLIEGHGVDPDIVVDNKPYETYQGKDAQLEAAIEYLKKLMEEEPVIIPDVPELPDKSFEYPGEIK